MGGYIINLTYPLVEIKRELNDRSTLQTPLTQTLKPI